MKNIWDIDKNFKVDSSQVREDTVFFNANDKPFRIYGLMYEDGAYRRMPQAVADGVSEGVAYLNCNTAGGRVSFKTNSPYVTVCAKMHSVGKMPHFALSGSAGFDLYERGQYAIFYVNTFIPPFDIVDGYVSTIDLGSREPRELIINFPLYSGVSELYIGISKDATLETARDYKHTEPMVFYGSSITQGGCASRPGNSYTSCLSSMFFVDHINLGFSGNAKGELAMADYIASLEMSLFIYDYDHNAPSVEHLMATHESFFKRIRAKNPHLPIIMLSRPKVTPTEDELLRQAVVEQTYQNAVARGDKNVYFISGRELMIQYCGNNGTVDNCHPNDLGFWSMARVLEELISGLYLYEREY